MAVVHCSGPSAAAAAARASAVSMRRSRASARPGISQGSAAGVPAQGGAAGLIHRQREPSRNGDTGRKRGELQTLRLLRKRASRGQLHAGAAWTCACMAVARTCSTVRRPGLSTYPGPLAVGIVLRVGRWTRGCWRPQRWRGKRRTVRPGSAGARPGASPPRRGTASAEPSAEQGPPRRARSGCGAPATTQTAAAPPAGGGHGPPGRGLAEADPPQSPVRQAWQGATAGGGAAALPRRLHWVAAGVLLHGRRVCARAGRCR